MKKVCHMTSAHPAEDIRIFYKECVSLVNSGYEVYLVERGDSYVKYGVHIVGVGEMPHSRIKRMLLGSKMVYKAAVNVDADIYHFHDPELLPYGLKLKKLGKKVFFDSHELTREQIAVKPYLPMWLARIISWCYSRYEDYILKRIDGVIFPCPINGRFPLPGKHKAYINNVPLLSELYDKYDSHVKKTNTICTVGSLTYNRGIKHLIKAAYNAQSDVALAGRISPVEFENELRNMPESKNVSFLGQVDRNQICTLLNQSFIGVSSILNIGQYDKLENLPTKVYEYMSMAMPVIMTKNKFNEKMIEQYQFGICVDPENIEEFSSAIMFLKNNPQKAIELGENGRKAIKEKFNWEKEVEKLIALYEEI